MQPSGQGKPLADVLRAGVTEEALRSAIDVSGYPLQATTVDEVVSGLADEEGFRVVQEEWSFLDSDHDVVRQLDGLIMQELVRSDVHPGDPRIPTDPRQLLRYEMDLLIECKRSDLPFLFFVRDLPSSSPPIVAGLPHDSIKLGRLGAEPRIEMPTMDALGSWTVNENRPQMAIKIAKARRDGSKLSLSGEDIYRGTTLPLSKAVSEFLPPPGTPRGRLYHTIRFVFPVVVLDSPMVGVRHTTGEPDLQVLERARLNISEPGELGLRSQPAVRAIDFVHITCVREYVHSCLRQSRQLLSRMDSFATQMITGRAIYDEPASTSDVEEFGGRLPFEAFSPHMTNSEVREWIRHRFIDAHSAGGEEETDDSDAPQIWIERRNPPIH